MTLPIVEVKNVYKRYSQNEGHPSMRHELSMVLKRLRGFAEPDAENPFYALEDVSFKIDQGEAVGLVGRNGSGKTTLLRILSGITRPTRGSVDVRGRYASLIGLGAGFVPKMTGRKNIYLNAAIHGIPPAEIEDTIPEIIEFSELGDFIDLPVNRYSSGMYARLGFSIAIHILPDIIFLDEVLSVGDQAFQAKCQQRIHEFRAGNRTFVFVSHSAKAILDMCDRAIWLNKGKMMMDGPAKEVMKAYSEHRP